MAALLVEGETTTLIGSSATKSAFLAQSAKARTVLVASHGVFWPGTPGESYIRFAGDPGAEGRLTVREIGSLKLQADLVFLSGCSTGLATTAQSGPQQSNNLLEPGGAGDDVLGLGVAFEVAGARRVIATLWDVADASSERFVKTAFEQVVAGAEPSEALQTARRALVETPSDLGAGLQTDHPAFWSPYFIVGP